MQSLMLVEPGEIHLNTKMPPPVTFDAIMIDPSLVMRLAEEAGLNPRLHFRHAATNDPALLRASTRFHSTLAEGITHLHLQSLLIIASAVFFAGHTEMNLRPSRRPAGHRFAAPETTSITIMPRRFPWSDWLKSPA